jgi:hypothetical protein
MQTAAWAGCGGLLFCVNNCSKQLQQVSLTCVHYGADHAVFNNFSLVVLPAGPQTRAVAAAARPAKKTPKKTPTKHPTQGTAAAAGAGSDGDDGDDAGSGCIICLVRIAQVLSTCSCAAHTSLSTHCSTCASTQYNECCKHCRGQASARTAVSWCALMSLSVCSDC